MNARDSGWEARRKAPDAMTPSALLDRHSDLVRAILGRFKLGNPRIFGSVARGEDHAQSDLDILVDPPPSASLYDLAAAEIELELLLGIRVDLVTKGFLAADVARQIDVDAVPIP